jgi:uridine kinase
VTSTLETVRIVLSTGEARDVPAGTSVSDLLPPSPPALVALFNNESVALDAPLNESGRLTVGTLHDRVGFRAYRNGLAFVLAVAAAGSYPGERVMLEHSLGRAIYGKLHDMRELCGLTVERLRDEMRRLVEADLPIVSLEVSREQARRIFTEAHDTAKLKLLEDWPHPTVRLHSCAGLYQLFPGPMVARTGVLRCFDLQPYPPGFVLCLPERDAPEKLGGPGYRPKLFRIFYEYERWCRVLGAETVGDLNEHAARHRFDTLMQVSEALHAKKIAAIADLIAERDPRPRVILISGPSSSGKTTFSRRLGIQLRVLGIVPETISLDDYFVSREETPRDENGDFDFETLAAIDVALFNRQLRDLLDGRTVVLPHFDFTHGVRQTGRSLRLSPGQLLIVEGIHGLNDALTPELWPHLKFKVYVSALTHLNVDDQNALSTSDVRLLRRIVRDRRSRNYSTEDTVARWPSVRAGEERHIFPFQESADVMFNSALVYELNALKQAAVEALAEVPPESPHYVEAQRLREMVALFRGVALEGIPSTSILREFIGESAFQGVG